MGWRCSAFLCNRIPARKVQWTSGLLAAFVYAGLAGFAIPTQRALVMLAVLFASRLLEKNLPADSQLAVAVVAVLLWDPLAVISPGFWLSFMAVAAILTGSRGYRKAGYLSSVLRMQLSISLVLMPVLVLFFGQVSLIAPLFNLLVIPVFSLFVVPLTMILAVFQFANSSWAEWLTQHFINLLAQLLELIAWFSHIEYASTHLPGNRMVLFVVCVTAVLIWLLPVKKISGMLAISFLLVFVLNVRADEDEQLRITLLDVGQGLSVLLTYKKQNLLYDLGPRYRNSGSATENIVLPYLKYRGIGQLDTLVISHSDADHAGDTKLFTERFRTEHLYLGEKQTLPDIQGSKRCEYPDAWSWQNIHFEFINPSGQTANNNNNSCVLRVSRGQFSLLLTGDIEKQVERQLLSEHPDKLNSTMIVIPHHGSQSSSSERFTQAVAPEVVLNSSGFVNRYHFPVAKVEARWKNQAEIFLDTSLDGAVDIWLDEAGEIQQIKQQASEQARYWRWDRHSLVW